MYYTLLSESHTSGLDTIHMDDSTTPKPHRDNAKQDGYVLPRTDYTVAPPQRQSNAAADLIRDKLAKIYEEEPDAVQEEKEAEATRNRSKHQAFIYELNNSGKDLAQVQTEWHNYYVSLSDAEKHEVWQEFYAGSQTAKPAPTKMQSDTEKRVEVRNEIVSHNTATARRKKDKRSTRDVQRDIRADTRKPPKSAAKQHAQSLLFGLGVGLITVLIFLFGFFNELVIAPFIQPARTTSSTPLIVSADTVAPTADPQIIIPKINVQIPIQFGATSNDEETMQHLLESGVVHYPTTAMPGQNGNSAYFGHSSNNIFNKGQYKFAFVLLHQLVPGDTFYITRDSKIYAYKVFSKTVVDPSEVGVLNPVEGHPATATLITCDPPGTSLRRLVIVGDQVSPDPSTNTDASDTAVSASSTTDQLAGNGRTLWGNFISHGYGKAIVAIVGVGAVIFLFRITSPKPKR